MGTPFESGISPKNYRQVTVSVGQTISNLVDLKGETVIGVYVPAGFSGTVISFQASPDGTNFFTVNDETGVALSVTVVAGTFVKIDPSYLAGIRYLKLVSGTIQASADSVLTLATTRLL
jgi:hypothetical protein